MTKIIQFYCFQDLLIFYETKKNPKDFYKKNILSTLILIRLHLKEKNQSLVNKKLGCKYTIKL